MKELSIEEKAKRYDEALKVLHKYDGANIMFSQSLKEEMFPELKVKESEDERTRNAAIDACKYMVDNFENSTKQYEDAIAWLEKQGEQKPKFRVGDTIKKESTGDIVTVSEIDLKNREYRLSNTGFIPFKYEYLWELVEQKPADKVEPKFHEGEWLCENEPNNYARFIQILEIVNVQGKDRYRISRDIHNDEDIVEFDFVEKYYHKFDIQDTKAGDVLVDVCNSLDNPLIFIFKDCKHIKHELATLSDYHSFCYLKASKKQEFGIDGWHNEHNLMPATKEQRDLMFQKMKEAGYEWDAEKKELKKNEQNPAWSEEDETALNDALWCCKQTASIAKDENDMGNAWYAENWLKSLKERVQPQNTWKPSDNELEVLRLAAEKDGTCLMGLYEQLKKLREE